MSVGVHRRAVEEGSLPNLVVSSLESPRKFYEETLGLKPVHEEGGEVVVYRSGNSTVNVYRSNYAGTNQATAVTWTVGNIEEARSGLCWRSPS